MLLKTLDIFSDIHSANIKHPSLKIAQAAKINFNSASSIKNQTIGFTEALAIIKSEYKIKSEGLFQELCQLVELEKQSLEDIFSLFFDSEFSHEERLEYGVVETPEHIASLIIRLALESFFPMPLSKIADEALLEISWFDPCVGAGAFPVAIINYYFNKHGLPSSVDQLPRITINDISPSGIFLALCAIKKILHRTKVGLDEYIVSGRLNFSVANTLKEYGESQSLLSSNKTYDIVIGNPPYVRSTRLDESYRNFLKRQFPSTYYGSADLYMYFIASGLSCLNKEGVLAFISPASFLRTKSGSLVRKFILKNSSLNTLIDFDETKIFQNADVHSAIYTLREGNEQKATLSYAHVSSLSDIKNLCDDNSALESALAYLPENQGWSFHTNQNSFALLNSIIKNSVSLSDLGIKVFSGIRPGYANAFILNQETAVSFSREVRDKWIKKIILPSNILRWRGSKESHYFIFIPHNSESPPSEILEYLAPYRERLAARPEVREPNEWYKLRTCSYYEPMSQKKIIYPDLSAKQRFSLCEEDIFIPDGAYFLDTDDLALLGILNSELAKEYFCNRCSSVGNLKSQGRFRFKKNYLHDFPLPASYAKEHELRNDIETVVKRIYYFGETQEDLDALNSLVTKFYGLSL